MNPIAEQKNGEYHRGIKPGDRDGAENPQLAVLPSSDFFKIDAAYEQENSEEYCKNCPDIEIGTKRKDESVQR